MRVRPAAVAGTFYPDDPEEARSMVRACLDDADGPDDGAQAPKAIVVPHAGWAYSGVTAAHAYRRIAPLAGVVQRVVLLGPAHREFVDGLATVDADGFATPLGHVRVDRDAVRRAAELPQVTVNDGAHALEHSLEVQLPFLMETLGAFVLVPFAVGQATDDQVAEVLDLLWGAEETLIVISTDLSHYHDYDTARDLDARTARAVESFEPADLDKGSACGRVPLRGLLATAARRGMSIERLDMCNSGDTAGSRDKVVGYGAWALTD